MPAGVKGYTTFQKGSLAKNMPSADITITDKHPIRHPKTGKEVEVQLLANDKNIIHKESYLRQN